MLLLPERLTLKPVSRPRPYGDRRFMNVFYKEPDWEKPRFVGVLEVFNSPKRQTYSVQAATSVNKLKWKIEGDRAAIEPDISLTFPEQFKPANATAMTYYAAVLLNCTITWGLTEEDVNRIAMRCRRTIRRIRETLGVENGFSLSLYGSADVREPQVYATHKQDSAYMGSISIPDAPPSDSRDTAVVRTAVHTAWWAYKMAASSSFALSDDIHDPTEAFLREFMKARRFVETQSRKEGSLPAFSSAGFCRSDEVDVATSRENGRVLNSWFAYDDTRSEFTLTEGDPVTSNEIAEMMYDAACAEHSRTGIVAPWKAFEKVAVRLVAGDSIPGYQGMILTDDSIRSIANRYPRNDEEYAFVSLFKESHLSDKNLSLGAAHDDYDGRYRKVAAIAWLLAREGRSALRSFES